MSGNSGTIKIALKIDDKGSVKVLKEVGSESEKAGQKGKKSMDSFGQGIKGASSDLKMFGLGINPATAGMAALAAGAVAAGAAVKAAARLGMEFQAGMKAVGAVSRATAEEYAQLEAAARQMGATTEWSASQSAGALKYLSMAGLSASDAIEALPGMLDLATAAQMDLGVASDIVTDTLSAFGMKTSDLTRLSDAFINTATRSNTTVEMLGESFKYVAPAAAQMGYSVEETSAILGVLANSGVKASMAGTNLQQILMKTADAAEEFGLGAGATLNEVLQEMSDRQLSANEVTKLFGLEAAKSAMILMNNVDAVKELNRQLTENQGATKQTADVMRDTLANDIKTLKSAIEETGLKMFDIFGPDLQDSVKDLTELVRKMKPAFEGVARVASGTFSVFSKVFDFLGQDIKAGTGYSEDDKGILGNITKGAGIATGAIVRTSHAVTGLRDDLYDADFGAWNDGIEKADSSLARLSKEAQIAQDSLTAIWVTDALDDYFDEIEDLEKEIKSGHKEIVRSDMEKWRKIDQHSMQGVDKAIKDFEREAREKQRTAATISSTMETMYKDIGLKGEENYQYQAALLERQAENYRAMGVEQDLVERWFTEQHRALVDQRILDSNDFFAGVSLGLTQTQREFSTWAEAGANLSHDMITTMSSEFSNVLVAGITGGIGDMEDRFGQAMDNMLAKLVQTAANMVVEWAATQVVSWGSAAWDWLTAEGGIWNLDATQIGKMYPDQYGQPGTPTVVHDGEMVVPAGIAGQIRDELARNGINDFDGLAAAMGPGGFTADGFVGVLGKSLLSNLAQRGVSIGAQGIDLASQGYDIGFGDVANAIFDGQGLVNAATGALAAAVNHELGMTSSMPGIAGSRLGAMAGMSLGGPLGSFLGAVLGATAGTGIGDITDTRSHEPFRDSWESFGITKAQEEYGRFWGAVAGWFGAQSNTSRAISQVNAAHGGIAGVTDINDPIGYDVDYGSLDDGLGWGGYGGHGIGNPGSYGGNNGPGIGDTGGGTPGRDPGGNFGLAKGGLVQNLIVPRGDDGWGALRLGEGVVSRQGMQTLERINDGFGIGVDMHEMVMEIRALRADLRQSNHPITRAVEKTARWAEIAERRAVRA